jgi:hypothetical protein
MTSRLFSAALLVALSSLSIRASYAADAPPTNSNDFRTAAAQHGAAATDPDHAGIWKGAIPPPGTVHGEFDANDPIALAAGVSVKADCSINWVDPDSGKRYCFATSTSLVSFLTAPRSYLARATVSWGRLGH